MKSVLLSATMLALLLPLSSGAHEDSCTTSVAEVDTGPTPHGRYYVDHHNDVDWFLSMWVYEESNGIDGLQRQDELRDDTAEGRCYAGDTLLF